MTGPQDPAGRGRLRAGHADREQVIEALKDAFVQGRLTRGELDVRAGRALAARTRADLAIAFAAVWVAANILDPHGLGNPYHPWSRLCLVVALAAVAAAFGIMLNGVGNAMEQRHSRRQLRARPGPGGRTL